MIVEPDNVKGFLCYEAMNSPVVRGASVYFVQRELPCRINAKLIWVDSGKAVRLIGVYPFDRMPMLDIILVDELIDSHLGVETHGFQKRRHKLMRAVGKRETWMLRLPELERKTQYPGFSGY